MLSINFSKKSESDFLKYIENLKGELADLVRAEVEDSMLKIEEKAASQVRVDTGNLKNSIQSKSISQKTNKQAKHTSQIKRPNIEICKFRVLFSDDLLPIALLNRFRLVIAFRHFSRFKQN